MFLDRDGTVSKEGGYINHPERIDLIAGSGPAIRRLNERGVLTVLTTNQAGVGRGYLTEPVLKRIHSRLEEQLAERNAHLNRVYYCPSHPDASVARFRKRDPDRKPGIGMIEKACRALPVDLSLSYTVGDKITDIEFAHNAGIQGVFVLSGYGLGEYEYQRKNWKVKPDHIAVDLKAAVAWILKDLRAKGYRP